jgi:predicted dehydrogenase
MLRHKIMPLNLAFLGCGFATRLHSKTLKNFKGEISCFYASRDRRKAIAFNNEFGGSGHFDSYEAAINDPKIDVVLVATPPASHLALTLQAVRAGKNAIVEKPPFLHAADFEIIRRAQNETGRRVLVAENYFYKPLAIKLRELIKADVIGEILFVQINAIKLQKTGNWRDDAQLAGGGALFEGGIHWINFIANLGLPIKSVRGLRPSRHDGPEKSLLVAIEYESSAVGTLSYSWEVPVLLKGIHLSQLYGRKGVITFESNGIFILVNGVRKKIIFPGLGDIAGYKGMFRDFLNALRTVEEPEMNLKVAQNDLQLIEMIYRAVESNIPTHEKQHTDKKG